MSAYSVAWSYICLPTALHGAIYDSHGAGQKSLGMRVFRQSPVEKLKGEGPSVGHLPGAELGEVQVRADGL